MKANLVKVLLVWLTIQINCTDVPRKRRSLAPFTGAGGSYPDEMSIPIDHWHCGSDSLTKNFTHSNIAKDCPSLAAAVNHCCAIHDDCYGQQLGQEFCDTQFCECNRMATRLPTEQGKKCRAMLEDSCLVLGIVGFLAYSDSDYSDPSKPANVAAVSPVSIPEIEEDYLYLYQVCPYVNITVASCSFNYDLCSNVHSVDYCASDLCHCLLDAAEASPKRFGQCGFEVDFSCRRILDYSTQVLASTASIRKSLTIFAFSILGIATLIFIGFSLWKKTKDRKSRQDKVENGKVIQIHSVESARSVNPLLEGETD